jgi:hypothetical protein
VFEVNDWKHPDCSLNLPIKILSKRETYSAEINEKYGEGGALNANYQTAEALAVAANDLGFAGMQYGVDFVFKTSGLYEISLDFSDKYALEKAKAVLQKYMVGEKIAD